VQRTSRGADGSESTELLLAILAAISTWRDRVRTINDAHD
jgi:hypothetical protein